MNRVSSVLSTSVIDTGGFFPNITVSDFLQLYRVPPSYSKAMMINAIGVAVLAIIAQLGERIREWQVLGYAQLSECSTSPVMINGKTDYEAAFITAVYSLALVDLYYRLLSQGERSDILFQGQDAKAKDSADYWQRQVNEALKLLQGETSCMAEMI